MNTYNSRNTGRKTSGRRNPKMVFFICLAATLGCFGALIYTATVLAGAANESAYTQAHGLSRSGTVISVTNYNGRDQSSDVQVRLEVPVDGQTVTTAHLPALTSLKPGAATQVLVDPKDPGYAEFPGHRYTPSSTAQVSAVAMLACIAFFAFSAAWWGRMWFRQRKSMRASPGLPQDAGVTS